MSAENILNVAAFASVLFIGVKYGFIRGGRRAPFARLALRLALSTAAVMAASVLVLMRLTPPIDNWLAILIGIGDLAFLAAVVIALIRSLTGSL